MHETSCQDMIIDGRLCLDVLIQLFTRYFDDLTFYRERIVVCIISIFFSNVVGDRK